VAVDRDVYLRNLAAKIFERSTGSTVTLHFGDRKSGPTLTIELGGGLHWSVVELLYKHAEFDDDDLPSTDEEAAGDNRNATVEP
jgi:hypothetical protein